MKHKVKNQPLRETLGGMDYQTYAAQERLAGGESRQANPDTLLESAGYYHVDEATKEIQARVHLMLKRAKQVLTENQYNAFVLVDIKRLKLREAAKVMEVSFTRVDQLVKRARVKLQQIYLETEDHV